MSVQLEDLIIGLLDRLLSQQQAQAQQATLDAVLAASNANLVLSREILGDVNTLLSQLAVAQAFLSNITAVVDSIQAMMATGSSLSALASQLAALSETWPTGWDTGAGNAVWETPIPTEGTHANVCLADAHYFALYLSNVQLPVSSTAGNNNLFRITGNWNVPGQAAPDFTFPPALDFSTILPTDATAFDWLTRIGAFSWTDLGDGLPALPDPGANTYFWVVWLPQDAWVDLKASLFGVAGAAPNAPVWPGLASVTLGTSLALSDGLVVPGPLDGVIVTITSVPVPISFYPFGTRKSYVRAGAILFVDDNGEAEFPAPIGIDDMVVTPKQMEHADHAVIRLASGVVGTVTPWSIT